MTYYGSKELAASFRTVRNNTIKIAEEIPAEQYSFRATPDTRTVAEMLVHIAVTPRLQEQVHIVERRTSLVGFDFFGFMDSIAAEEQAPRSKDEILTLLRAEGEKYAAILEGATEEFLAERVDYPEGMVPPVKSRFEMMMAPKEHEMHHRGQLMMIQRMLGAVPHLTRNMQEAVASMKAAQSAG
jgi:uncharacterized damage-inducible protein DinB